MGARWPAHTENISSRSLNRFWDRLTRSKRKEPRAPYTRLSDGGGAYEYMHPTKGWRRVSFKREGNFGLATNVAQRMYLAFRA